MSTASGECPMVALVKRDDGDYDVVRCDRPEGHDDMHHSDDPRISPSWAADWAYDPVRVSA